MNMRSVLILGVMAISAGCQDRNDAAAPVENDARPEISGTSEASTPLLDGNPSVANCTQQLASWLGEGGVITAGESRATPSGCEFTAEAKGLDYEGVKAAVVSSLSKHGYSISGSTDVSNGQRLTFKNGDYDISVLCRPSENAKTTLEGSTARLDLHWYDRGAARAHRNSAQ